MRRLVVAVLAVVGMLALPDVAHACPVCFSASEENRQAFLVTTAFLTLLPLGMVGGAGLWLRKRARELDRDGQDGSGERSTPEA